MTQQNARPDYFDPGDEDAFTLSRGHKSIEPGYWALRRMAFEGREAADGSIVRLEVCVMPDGLSTTVQAYRRFISRLNAQVPA